KLRHTHIRYIKQALSDNKGDESPRAAVNEFIRTSEVQYALELLTIPLLHSSALPVGGEALNGLWSELQDGLIACITRFAGGASLIQSYSSSSSMLVISQRV